MYKEKNPKKNVFFCHKFRVSRLIALPRLRGVLKGKSNLKTRLIKMPKASKRNLIAESVGKTSVRQLIKNSCENDFFCLLSDDQGGLINPMAVHKHGLIRINHG